MDRDDFLGEIGPGKFSLFTIANCPFCDKAKNFLMRCDIECEAVFCSLDDFTPEIKAELEGIAGIKTFPKIFIGNKCIGGYSEMVKMIEEDKFFQALDSEGIKYKKPADLGL